MKPPSQQFRTVGMRRRRARREATQPPIRVSCLCGYNCIDKHERFGRFPAVVVADAFRPRDAMDGEYDPFEWLDDDDGFGVDLELEEPYLDDVDYDDGEPSYSESSGVGFHLWPDDREDESAGDADESDSEDGDGHLDEEEWQERDELLEPGDAAEPLEWSDSDERDYQFYLLATWQENLLDRYSALAIEANEIAYQRYLLERWRESTEERLAPIDVGQTTIGTAGAKRQL
jgi:hypothetical protein